MQFIPSLVLVHLLELLKFMNTSENDYAHHIPDDNSNAFSFSLLNMHTIRFC